MIRIGCAGWTIPKEYSGRFGVDGSHLTRYSSALDAVEINSSFYRPHRPSTYAKWAESVPSDFRFAVKAPKDITHVQRLIGTEELLDRFLLEVRSLGSKLGPILIQLPPSLQFRRQVGEAFFTAWRDRYDGRVAIEPRHASWFDHASDDLLKQYRIARVAADPALNEAAAEPGGDGDTVYFRLHGSPKMYYSNYDDPYLEALARRLMAVSKESRDVWCVFDNTAAGAAQQNALDLAKRIQMSSP